MTLQEQLKAIETNWDNWHGRIHRKTTLILNGDVQPSVISPVYKIKISFELGKNPIVRVLSPVLKLYPGKSSLPHVHSNPGSPLCLFWYEFDNAKDLIADTTIKWITWWLYFYEIWAETGEWTARGTHPWLW